MKRIGTAPSGADFFAIFLKMAELFGSYLFFLLSLQHHLSNSLNLSL
jgi:hypothetical protein